MRYTYIFFLILGSLSNAQSLYKATYKVNSDYSSKEEVLIFNNDNSVYHTNVNNYGQKVVNKENVSTEPNPNKIISNSYYKAKDKDMVQIAYNGTVISDSIYFMKWKEIGDPFLIDKYIAQKSESFFRGTIITITYTREIPTSFGPWKFNNVPGLVLRVTTNDKDTNKTWTLINFEKVKNLDSQELLVNHKNFKKFITYKEYVSNRDASAGRRGKTVVSRMGKEFSKSTYKHVRVGIEKVYEWELENEKKQ